MLTETYTDGLRRAAGRRHRLRALLQRHERATLHLFQSVSKSLTGMLAGILVAMGAWSWSSPIGDYLPELRDSGYADATIRTRSTCSSRSSSPRIMTTLPSEMNRQDRAAAWRPLLPGDIDGLYQFAATIRKDAEHGQVFQYCSLTTDVLGWILSRVSGRTFAELLSQEIWSKLGCEHDARHHR